jgi:DNA-binding transcriptional regulator YiaG
MSSAETAEQDITSLVETRAALANGHVRELRKRARLTQRELARALNVSPPTVSRWESQLRQPRGEAAQRLADIVRLLERLSDPESAKPAVAGSKASRGSSTSDKSS